MAVESKTPAPWWRRLVRALMPWDQDPALAVMGGLLLLLIASAALGLLVLMGYIIWTLGPRYPVVSAALGAALLGLVLLVWLLRSRCPRCRRFFAARRTGTTVDRVATTSTLGGAVGSRVQVSAERVVVIRSYRCRRCGAEFTRRG